MKKGLLFLLLFVSMFLLVGCGDKDDDEETKKESSKIKTMTCVADISGVKSTIEMKYDTKNEVVKSALATYEMDLSSLSDEQLKNYDASSRCNGFDNKTFNSCDAKIKNKTLVVQMDMNIETMVKNEFGGDEHFSFEKIQQGYEQNLNADCTVK